MVLLMVPIGSALLYSKQILVLCGQNQDVASQAQVFIYAFLPSLFFQGIGDCLVRLLNNLGKTQIPFISSAVGILLHYFISWYFVIACNYQIVGTGIALCITYNLIYLMMLLMAMLDTEISAAIIKPDRRIF